MKLIYFPFTHNGYINPDKIVAVRPFESADPASKVASELEYESGAVTRTVYFEQTASEVAEFIRDQLENT